MRWRPEDRRTARWRRGREAAAHSDERPPDISIASSSRFVSWSRASRGSRMSRARPRVSGSCSSVRTCATRRRGGRDRTLFGDRQLEIGQRENALFRQRVDALGVGGSDLREASKEERTSGQADARFHCPHTSCEVSIARRARGVSCGLASRPRPGRDARARPSPRTGDRRRCTSGTSGRDCSTRRNRAPSRNT